MIRFAHVSKDYPKGAALKNVSLHVAKGEFVFLTGHSGAGKSTILKMMYGELRPTAGDVRVSGYSIGDLSASDVPRLRRRLGVVFQDFRLLEDRTAEENVAFALEVTPSAAGRLAGLLFQSLPPQIVLDAGDGERRYRLVPGMLATPVLLSPHLRTSEDLLALGAPPPAAGFGHAVRRLRFEVAPPAPLLAGHEDFGRALYHDTLKLRLYRVRGLPDAGFTAAYRSGAVPGP